MKPVDGDALMEEFKKNDLSFMQQKDIMDCLQDIINRQPLLKEWENKNQRYLIIREFGIEEILVMPNEDGKTWSYVNLTKGVMFEDKFHTIGGVLAFVRSMGNKVIRIERLT